MPAIVVEGKAFSDGVEHPLDELETLGYEDVVGGCHYASILVEQGQLQYAVNGFVDEGILPDLSDLAGCFVADPVVGPPGVHLSDLISSLLGEMVVIVDKHVSFH